MVKILGQYGFCSGINRAIDLLNENKKKKKDIYLTHPLMHNSKECDKLCDEKTKSIEDSSLTEEDIVFFSAHGHTLEEEIKYKNNECIDPICPFIKKRYDLIFENRDKNILFIGKKGHQETISFLSHFPSLFFVDVDADNVNIDIDEAIVLCQSTISSDRYEKILDLIEKKTKVIKTYPPCPTYLKRYKDAVTYLDGNIKEGDALIVSGSKTSSNANSLYNLLKNRYSKNDVYLVEESKDIDVLKGYKDNFYIVSSTSISKEEVDDIAYHLDKKYSS